MGTRTKTTGCSGHHRACLGGAVIDNYERDSSRQSSLHRGKLGGGEEITNDGVSGQSAFHRRKVGGDVSGNDMPGGLITPKS